VIVPGDDAVAVSATVDSVLRSARRSASSVQVLVPWRGDDEPPELPGAQVRPTCVWLGGAYAVNRALELVDAPLVAVLPPGLSVPDDWAARAGGPGGERHRVSGRPLLDTAWLRQRGGLDQALPLSVALREAAARNGPVARIARRVGRRVAGGQERRPSSRRPLAALPPQLGLDPVSLTPLLASARAKNHLMYRSVDERVLHLYAAPSARLLRSVDEREQVRLAAPDARVPRLHAAVPGPDCLWVLEDAVAGEPLAGPPARWWPEAADWVVDLAGPPGPPLAQTPRWAAVVEECLLHVPPASREPAARALRIVGSWPSRHQHGDLQPKNVVRSPTGLAAVDWEGVWLHGVPGLDLLFLALLAHPGGANGQLLPQLLHGADSSHLPVLPGLARLGVRAEDVRPLVTACLAQWTRGEARRRAQLGAPLTRRSSTEFFQQWALLDVA
jgi:hypothetical protein